MAAHSREGAFSLRAENIMATFGNRVAVDGVSLRCEPGAVTAIIGPSGCGKSTLLRCFNRLHELVPGAHVTGTVTVGDDASQHDIYAPGTNVIALRRRIGMVFQRATPFPALSVRDNVAAGVRNAFPALTVSEVADHVESALLRAGLWDEVRDHLDDSALLLSGGQQQRLCIARTLATGPRLLLLDEPTASLDPLNTQRIEELVYNLRGTATVVIVTHNMQQAARVSDRTAFMLDGKLVEIADTRTLFTMPGDQRTEAYVTGRFG